MLSRLTYKHYKHTYVQDETIQDDNAMKHEYADEIHEYEYGSKKEKYSYSDVEQDGQNRDPTHTTDSRGEQHGLKTPEDNAYKGIHTNGPVLQNKKITHNGLFVHQGPSPANGNKLGPIGLLNHNYFQKFNKQRPNKNTHYADQHKFEHKLHAKQNNYKHSGQKPDVKQNNYKDREQKPHVKPSDKRHGKKDGYIHNIRDNVKVEKNRKTEHKNQHQERKPEEKYRYHKPPAQIANYASKTTHKMRYNKYKEYWMHPNHYNNKKHDETIEKELHAQTTSYFNRYKQGRHELYNKWIKGDSKPK